MPNHRISDNICPCCQKTLSEQAAANTSTTVSIDVPISLLASLESALAIGRNAAMMRQEPEVREGLEALRKTVDALLPDVSRQFDRGNWAALVTRMISGTPLVMQICNVGSSWAPQYAIKITDLSGTPWPHANFKTASILQGYETSDLQDVEASLAELTDLEKRLSPMS